MGDKVDEDARLADVMTDKATVELESPVAGIVIELAGEAGDRLAIGSALVTLEVEGDSGGEVSGGPSTSSGRADLGAKSGTGSVKSGRLLNPAQKSAQAEPVEAHPRLSLIGSKVLASPAVRARARSLGIDLAKVPAGPDLRIDHADLDAYLSARVPAPAPVDKPEHKPVEMLPGAGEQIKVIGLRRRIAEAMSASKRHIPHFSYVEECDVTALEALRVELNALGPERPKLTLLPLLIRAICLALPRFPMINARFDDEAGVVTRYNSVHLGVAVQTDAGLMVPVVRDAQAIGIWPLAAEIARLASAARDLSALPEELTGSTLTITSLGPLGGISTTPVINRPEVAIIGPNRISISCDHRVIDGWDAANFVRSVKQGIERPMLLLVSSTQIRIDRA